MGDEIDPLAHVGKLSDREILILTCGAAHRAEKSSSDAHKRISRLEAWRNMLAGAGTAIATVFGWHLGGGKH